MSPSALREKDGMQLHLDQTEIEMEEFWTLPEDGGLRELEAVVALGHLWICDFGLSRNGMGTIIIRSGGHIPNL